MRIWLVGRWWHAGRMPWQGSEICDIIVFGGPK